MKVRRLALMLAALLGVLLAIGWIMGTHAGVGGERPMGWSPGRPAGSASSGAGTLAPILSASPGISNGSPPSASTAKAGGAAPATRALASGKATAEADASGAPGSVEGAGGSASINVAKVRRMIGDYHTLMGENPIGTNAEIMQAVMGKNPHQAVLGPPDGESLNGQGELVDDWGTPYFFHQLSKDRMEIRSAGPDKIFGTPDDIILK